MEDAVVVPTRQQWHDQILEFLRRRGYTSQKPEEVLEFLSRHSSLLKILDEAQEQIQSHFDKGVCNLTLDLVKDPEAESDEELIVFIRTDLPIHDALKRLDKLDDNWWLEAGSRVQGNLGINLEFVIIA